MGWAKNVDMNLNKKKILILLKKKSHVIKILLKQIMATIILMETKKFPEIYLLKI